tara:strand:- start:137 stop:349 length:213 start_codon:yes stop_codon:yes gene_type:complete
MDRRTKLEINMVNASEDYEDSFIVNSMKKLLYTLSTDKRNYIEDSDELEEAARVMIEYFGIPDKDYTYEG